MSFIKRYDIEADFDSQNLIVSEFPYGSWCKNEDVDALEDSFYAIEYENMRLKIALELIRDYDNVPSEILEVVIKTIGEKNDTQEV